MTVPAAPLGLRGKPVVVASPSARALKAGPLTVRPELTKGGEGAACQAEAIEGHADDHPGAQARGADHDARLTAVLPDVLAADLAVVFCGTAAGAVSARVGAPYAGPGNRFWPTLHATGLTPRRLEPLEFRAALRYGIGLTDLCKTRSGADHELGPGAFDVERLAALVDDHRPGVVAFTSLTAGRAALGPGAVVGPQPQAFAGARAWVLPSPSGRAVRWWDPAPWHALVAALHAPPAPAPDERPG